MSICLYVYMSICLYVYMSICLYVYMSICLYVYMSIYLYIYMSICLYLYMSIYLYVYMSICLRCYNNRLSFLTPFLINLQRTFFSKKAKEKLWFFNFAWSLPSFLSLVMEVVMACCSIVMACLVFPSL